MEILPSEKKELLSQIASLRQDKDAAYAAALRKVNRIILSAPFLSHEERDWILDRVWDFDRED